MEFTYFIYIYIYFSFDFRSSDGKNSSDSSPTPNTPKRVLSKFNSFKMGSSMFRSMTQGEVSIIIGNMRRHKYTNNIYLFSN